MKRPCANNIFTNPEAWASKAVGALWRYRFSQVLTVFGGVCLFVISVLGRRRGYMDCLGVAVLIGAFGIAFPLMYLRALRYLYLEMQRSQNNQQDASLDRRGTPGSQ